MITVFTSSYNYGKHLRKAIESVLSQTYTDFEYHLIDYGSTDDTWDIMNDYKDDRIIGIKMGCQVNKTFAMNRSIKLAKSGYWSWCPADDYWHPSLLQTKVEYSEKYPEAVLYDDFWIIDDRDNIIQEVSLPDSAIGYHWYAGHPVAQEFNNKLNENTFREYNCLFSNLIKAWNE